MLVSHLNPCWTTGERGGLFSFGARVFFLVDDIDFFSFCRSFSLKIHHLNVNNTEAILAAVSSEVIVQKRQQLRAIYHRFLYHQPPVDGDAFFTLLTMLDRRRRFFKSVGRAEFQ